MASRSLIILLLLASINIKCFSQGKNKEDSLLLILSEFGQVKVNVPYSPGITELLSKEVSIVSVDKKIVRLVLSQNTIDWFIGQNINYNIEKVTPPKKLYSAPGINEARAWNVYPTYSQYISIMQGFATEFPGLCRLDTIGTSIEGRLILAIKISDNPVEDEDEPEAFYTSTMHGDETGGFVLMLHLIDYLLSNYNTVARVENLVDNLEIWINPLANPDGTYKNGDEINSPARFNANGYDLNRTFPDPQVNSSPIQKETSDMIAFMRNHRFVISANFHSGSEVVNYPWDRWLYKIHADNDWFNAISRAYADTVHKYSPPGYMTYRDNGVTRGAAWYIIYGGRQDFVTYELQGREVTIELDDQFVTPVENLQSLWEYNWRSLLGYLENALYGIHGTVLNDETSEPLAARIFIRGHDKDSSFVYSDSLTGSYVRMLSPGSWDLTFTAPGFNDKLISGIQVSPFQKTIVNVRLTPAGEIVDTIDIENILMYPNPAQEEIKAALPSDISGKVTVRIFNSAGTIVADYLTEINDGVPHVINLRKLSAGVYTVIFTNHSEKITYKGRFIHIK